MSEQKTISVGPLTVGNEETLTLIGGPCAIESEEDCLKVGTRLRELTDELGIDYIFKSSYDKANRSSIHSYRGPGLEEGLGILQKVKNEVGVPITTDFHTPAQAEPVSQVADLIQVPAFLSRQTDMLVAAAETDSAVNVKKGQFLSPWDVDNVFEKLAESGEQNIMITERGASFGYQNLVVDVRSLSVVKNHGWPIVMDATHSVQRPGGLGDETGGDRQFVVPLSRAAVAQGIACLFWEVHPEPSRAKSDSAVQMPLDQVESELRKVVEIDHFVKNQL